MRNLAIIAITAAAIGAGTASAGTVADNVSAGIDAVTGQGPVAHNVDVGLDAVEEGAR